MRQSRFGLHFILAQTRPAAKCRLAQTLGLAKPTVSTASININVNTMKFEVDSFLYICQEIETELCEAYRENSRLTDQRCIYALDRTKIDVKQAFGFSMNESAQLEPELASISRRIVQVAKRHVNTNGGPSLKEFNARIDKILRSVRRHAQDGSRSYFEFVQDFFPRR